MCRRDHVLESSGSLRKSGAVLRRASLLAVWILAVPVFSGCFRKFVPPDDNGCGDGRVVLPEECDDGNGSAGDGCTATCQIEPGWICEGEPSACTPECGDGLIIATEMCDDENAEAADGCSAACQVEPGWSCTGEPSFCVPECGDGVIVGPERCDDGNTDDEDGCSAACDNEPGWVCTGEPSVCNFTCGNGQIDAGEACDDTDLEDGDGCSAVCRIESGWVCTGEPSACTAECGDGLIVDTETCDDGNTSSGDGCSGICHTEAGWQCTGEPSVCVPIATGWYAPAWDYRKRITVDPSHVASDLVGFPVLVFFVADADLASYARTDGHDIVFTSADGTTKLSHEIQNFDGTSGLLAAWVKVPLLSSSNPTELYMYFGNSGSTDQQNVADVWSNGYEAVLHLQEVGSGVEYEYLDSSGNGHHGTGGGLSGGGDPQKTPSRTGGLFGFAQDFDDTGQADLIRLDAVDDRAWTEITVQAWVNTDDDGDDRIFAKTWGTNPGEIVWQLGKTSVNKIRLRTDTEPIDSEGGTAFTHGTWTHLAMTWVAGNPGTVTVYRNGQVDLTATISGANLYDSYPIPAPTIGNVPSGDRGFNGQMQEVRLLFAARSLEWLETEFINQFSPSTFYSVSTLEASQ